MNELQRDGSIHTLNQMAICESREELVKWYGLDQPDIVSYTIEEVVDL